MQQLRLHLAKPHLHPHTRRRESKATIEGLGRDKLQCDAFRKGVTSGTTLSRVRDGPGFRSRKKMFGNTTQPTGEAAPKGVTVAEALAQEAPSTNVRPRATVVAVLHTICVTQAHITMSNNINGEDQLDGADEVKEVKRRGKTKLINVWNIPRGHRVVVNCNELNQPIGEEAGVLAKFLGMVARNSSLCSLSFKDWRLLIGKKDRNHKQINKEAILNQVKKRFLYPARMETWVLRTIGERWRQHKSNLKSIYFDPHKSQDANNSNAPDGVLADQWVALVNNWMTPKAQDLSEANRINCTRRKSMHTSGTKSFARNREELREQDPEKKYPHRVVLYIHTHKSNIGNNRNAHVGELKELLAQQPDLADSSNGKDAWEGDALNRILGKEKPSHIHGLGLVPNPKQVFDPSTSSRMKHLNVTTLDETSSEDVVSLRLELEKLQKHVQKQDDTILDLQHTVERQKRQHGYPDAPLSPPTDVRPAMKRQSKPPQSRREALHASRVSASIKVSTDIFLKSTRYPNRKVALGRVLSQDPKTKVGDVALGKKIWMVRVSLVFVRDEPLIRPYNNFKVLGQVGNNPIAWPSSCIEKVNW
uniref:Transposase Tnp1/En/Spm-like domain-containing protein n=1 Tax=Zea mays TaxID=4577 RepID=A0A804PFQ0_MAIZE